MFFFILELFVPYGGEIQIVQVKIFPGSNCEPKWIDPAPNQTIFCTFFSNRFLHTFNSFALFAHVRH